MAVSQIKETPTKIQEEKIVQERKIDNTSLYTNTKKIADLQKGIDGKISKTEESNLKASVKYSAKDSIKIDTKKNIVHLYGDAKIKYGQLELIAEYVCIYQHDQLIFARGQRTGEKYVGRPVFKSGEDEPILSDSLYYNLKSKKGKTFNSNTKYDGSYLSGGQSKKIDDGNIAIHNVIYSTCDAPKPHFGIYITKGMVGENNIATGPAFLVVENFVTPLGIPFGFFPKQNKKSSGVTLPSFGEDFERGFYFSNLGIYIGESDKWDYYGTASIWTNGDILLSNSFSYKKRYRYSGEIGFSANQAKTEKFVQNTSNNPGFISSTSSKDYKFRWQHRLDNKAVPNMTFNININYQTGNYNNNSIGGGTNNPIIRSTNNVNSSVYYSKKFDGKVPMQYNVNLGHSQDLKNRTISFNQFPNFNFSISSFNPFKRTKNKILKILFKNSGFKYSVKVNNSMKFATEEEFSAFDYEKKMLTKITHDIPTILNGNYKLLKHINWSYSVPYSEEWQLQSTNISLVGNQTLTKVRDFGFVRKYRYSFGLNSNFRLYATKYTKGKFIKAFRHTLEPHIGLSYTPNFNDEKFPFVKSYTKANGEKQLYDPFTGSNISGSTEAASLNFSLKNSFEIKLPSKKNKDGVTKPIRLIDNLNTGFSYNFLANTHHMSKITYAGNIKFTPSGKQYISFSGNIDPYIYKGEQRTNDLSFAKGKLPSVETLNLNFQGINGLSVNKIISKMVIKKKKTNKTTSKNTSTELESDEENTTKDKVMPEKTAKGSTTESGKKNVKVEFDGDGFQKFALPWDITLNPTISMGFTKRHSDNTLDRTKLTLSVSGSWFINLSSKWSVSGSYNYDFITKQTPNLSFSIKRDLHCWEFNLSWTPFGFSRGFHVIISPKSALLKDLKWEKRRERYNTAF